MDVPPYLTEKPSKDDVGIPAEEKRHDLPFEQISWTNFERLCLRLAMKSSDVYNARPYGVQGDEQLGIDIFAYNKSKRLVVYQCKNEKSFSPAKIKAAVNKFVTTDLSSECDEFILCTREALQKKDRSDEVKEQTTLLAGKSITFTIWDSVALNNALKEHPQIVYDFFGLNWVYAFCGRERAKDLKLDNPIPEKENYKTPTDYLSRTLTKISDDHFGSLFQREQTLIDVFPEHQKIALLGWGLNGKSFEMQNLAVHLSKSDAYHPHLIQFSNYTDEPIESLIKDIQYIPQDTLAVLIDGLDEVLPIEFDRVRRRIDKFAESYPMARIVVSCRTNYYTAYTSDKDSDTLKGFEAFSLSYWGFDEINKHLQRILKDDADKFLSLVNQRQMFDLLRLPFYLLKLTEQYKNEGTIVNSKAEIFEEDIRRLIKKDVRRNYTHERELKENKLYGILAKLAFVMEASGTNFINAQDLEIVLPDYDERIMAVNSASIFYATGTEPKNYRFYHHNTQEYLAAGVLAKQTIRAVKRIVAIEPEYRKIKPSWYDTVLFLYTIMGQGDQLKEDLLKWLIKDNKELAIKLEPYDIKESIRIAVFLEIFNKYKKEQRRINGQLYRYDDVANFSACPPVFEFLFLEFRNSTEVNNLANVMEILSDVDVAKFPEYYDAFKEVFKEALAGNMREVHYSALLGFTENYNLSFIELKGIFDKFIDSTHDLIRPQLFRSIYRLGYTDQFVNEIINHLKLLIAEERQRFQQQHHSSRVGTEYGEVARCLERMYASESILKVLDGLGADFLTFVQLTYFEDTLAKILANITVALDNEKPIAKIIELFKQNHSYILNNLKASKAFLEFFSNNDLTEDIAADLVEEVTETDASLINSISILATSATVELLHEKQKTGGISARLIDSLNYFLEKNENIEWAHFKEVFEIPDPMKKPSIDFSKSEMDRQARDLNALFNEEKFKEETNLIFDGFGKDDISYNDIDFSQPDYWSEKYCSIVRETLELRPSGPILNRQALMTNIDNNWPVHFFQRIYRYLLKNKNAELTPAQKSKLLNWCDMQAGSISFKNAIKQENEHSWSLDENAVMLSFYIRKFELKSYSQQLYLDMLSFVKYNDDEEAIMAFVESVDTISVAQINATILNNLKAGVKNAVLLSTYLDYIREKKLVSAAPLLIEYISDQSIPDRYPILKLYKELAGNVDGLQPRLSKMTDADEFKISLIESFVESGGIFIENYLLQKFRDENSIEAKDKLAGYLTRLGNNVGTAFYLKRILENGIKATSNSENNPLLFVNKVKYVYPILKIIKFSKQVPRNSFPGHDIRAIALRALQNLALTNGQYTTVFRRVRLWIYKERLLKRLHKGYDFRSEPVALIELYWESIDKQQLNNNSRNPSISQSLSIFGSFA